MDKKLFVKRSLLVEYLEAIQKVNDSFILDIKNNTMSVIATSSDNTLIFYGRADCESDDNMTLNVPDARKLLRAVKFITDDNIQFKISSNALKYASKSVRFKYHLYEDDFLKRPKIKVEKIEAFDYHQYFKLTKSQIQTIMKGSAFASETTKLYFYSEDGNLYAELGDKVKQNTDNFSILLGELEYDFEPLVFKLENLQMVDLISDVVRVSVNTDLKVLSFDVESAEGDIKLKYIVTCLKQ